MQFTVIFLSIFATLALAAPVPDAGSAYTGAGGSAIGGSETTAGKGYGGVGGLKALDIASGNAGDGGDSSSGNALGGDAFGK
jgi:hypothetical protein